MATLALAEGHDVFVSYAHADNGIAAWGASSPVGWVSALAANLNEGPSVYKKRIFIDHQLKPGDQFSDDLLVKVQRSQLLVLLLSQNYVESSWCGKELEYFVRTHGGDPEKPADVYVVELVPYETLTSVPPVIQALRARLIHAKFWCQRPDAGVPVLSGYPNPKDSGAEVHYWSVLNDLRVAIDIRLRGLRDSGLADLSTCSPSAVAVGTKSAVAVAPLGTVLLADTTEDLELQRMAVKVALEPEGIVVLPDGDYVGLTASEFDTAMAADLGRSDLYVQLLSPTIGRRGKGLAAPLPQLQFQRAQAAALPIMQWCERVPPLGEIVDPAHAKLFETEFLRVTHLSAFKTEVIERLRAEKVRRERFLTTQPVAPAGARARRKLIFVDDLASLPALTCQLRAVFREQNCDVRSLPRNAPLGNNGIDISELLRPCRAGITIYADRTKYATAYNRLVYFLNQVAEHDLDVGRWGVYMEQGTVMDEFGIESDGVVAVNTQCLGDFLRTL